MPSRRQFCGYCELPVLKHKESTGLIDGVLYHKRRCYPKHLKEVRKRERNAKKSELLHRIPARVGADRSDRRSVWQPRPDDPGVFEMRGHSG